MHRALTLTHCILLTLAGLTAGCAVTKESSDTAMHRGFYSKKFVQQEIARLEGTPGVAGNAVLKVEYQGKNAYLFISPCCDHLNYLYDANAEVICAPSGGFFGTGDGKCTESFSVGKRGPNSSSLGELARPERQ